MTTAAPETFEVNKYTTIVCLTYNIFKWRVLLETLISIIIIIVICILFGN